MPRTIVIFGFTGDLMRTKGIPALFSLYQEGEWALGLRIIGISRNPWTKESLREHVRNCLTSDTHPDLVADFCSRIEMVQGDTGDSATYQALKDTLGTGEPILMYLCVAPNLFAEIITHAGDAGLLSNARIMIEKPFGTSGGDAKSLQSLITRYCSESHIYRIDHYLAKDSAEEIARFGALSITSIRITLLETAGVEKRGDIYDSMGALMDVGQNHLLIKFALLAGHYPDHATDDQVHAARAEALSYLPELTRDEVARNSVRGQYEGYEKVQGVRAGSQTETFFKISGILTGGPWAGAGLVIAAGKKLGTTDKKIVALNGDEEVGHFSLASGRNEYEVLFADALRGSRRRFVSFAEVEAQWRFIDPIRSAWSEGVPPLRQYEPGSDAILEA